MSNPSDGNRGSSPLARGTLDDPEFILGKTRLIPARAGNTAGFPGFMEGAAAHPRSRGEHANSQKTPLGSFGSSPLARGTQSWRLWQSWCVRLIPARAGNTFLRGVGMPRGSAHPRSRGEHDSPPHRPEALLGSSPLARGTPGRNGRHQPPPRLIPARAGNTWCR